MKFYLIALLLFIVQGCGFKGAPSSYVSSIKETPIPTPTIIPSPTPVIDQPELKPKKPIQKSLKKKRKKS